MPLTSLGTLGQALPTTIAPTTTTTLAPTTTTTMPVTTATTTAKAPVVKRFEQGDAGLAYVGTWKTNAWAPAASARSFRYANSVGSSVTVTFTGTSFVWVTKKSPVYGKARLILDGGAPTIVDLYSAKEVWQQKVWQSGTLSSGTHTVTISWTGTKNPAATGYNIGTDAFDIAGTLGRPTSGLVVVIDPGHQAKADLQPGTDWAGIH